MKNDVKRSENRIRPFVGELFENPAPLEMSFNTCSGSCHYCFASLNGRDVENTSPTGTLSFIRKVFDDARYNPKNFGEWLLRRRHPVAISNSVDPVLTPSNEPMTRAILATLRKVGVPVMLMTRGYRTEIERFREIADLLTPGSVLYMSVTTFDEDVRRQVEPGVPTNEQRLLQMAMAKEVAGARGIKCVAALNPIVPEWAGDPGDFIDRCVEIAGEGVIDGSWYEPLHITRRQHKAWLGSKRGLPVVAQGDVIEAATSKTVDGAWFNELRLAIDAAGWKKFSLAAGFDGDVSLFDLWPNPFPTHHVVTDMCRQVSAACGGAPVGVTFDAFCSYLDIDDMRLSKGDAWSLLNQKQDVDKSERHALPESMPMRSALSFMWNRPESRGTTAVWGAYGMKAVMEGLDENGDRIPGVRARFSHFDEDPDHIAAVWAPMVGFGNDEHFARYEEVADMVMLPPRNELPPVSE